MEDEGIATERYQIYLESTEAKIKEFQLALQEMYTTIINSNMINSVIDMGTKIVNLINDLGGLPKTMGLVIASIALFKNKAIAFDIAKVAVKGFAKYLDMSKELNLAKNGIKGLSNILSGNLIYAFKDVGTAITAYKNNIISAETLTKALAPAISAVTTALSIGVMAYTVYSAHKQKMAREAEEQKQRTLEEAQAYHDNAKALSELKDSYTEITNSTKSVSEKKNELRQLQEQLIDTYGIEASSIDLVNGSYEEQIGKLDELNKRKREAAEIAMKTAYADAQNEVNDTMKNVDIGHITMGLGKESENMNKAIEEITSNMEKVSLEMNLKGGTQLHFDVDNAEEYCDVLHDILLRLEAYGLTNSGLYKDLNTQYQDLNDSLDNLSEAQKNLFQFNYDQDLGNIAEKLGIKDLSSITEEEFSKIKNSMKDTFDSEEVGNGYKDFAMNMLESLPVVREETDALKESMVELTDVEDLSEGYKKLADNANNIQKLIDSIDEAKGLTQETLDAIITQYPELLSCINDETALREALVQRMEVTKEAQLDLMRQMLMADEEYYNQKILKNEEAYNTITAKLQEAYTAMGMMYTGDLANYNSMEEAKAKTTEDLINKLQQAWAQYFSSLGAKFNQISQSMATVNKLMPTNPLVDKSVKGNAFYQNSMSKKDELFRQAEGVSAAANAEISKITSQMDKLSKIFDDYEPKNISIDVKGSSPKMGGSKGGGGSKGSKGKKSGKDKKTDYDAWLKDQIEQIEKHGKELDEQIELVEQKLSNAKDLGNSDLVKEYRQQLIDLHKEKKDNLVAEKEALKTLKAKINGEEHIKEVQEKVSEKILAWEKEKQELLEQEIGLIDDKWEHELNGIKQSQELLENTYTDVEADPDEALRVAREKVKLQKEELAIAKEKLAEYRNLGLMEDNEQVIELETEIVGLSGDLISDQLGVIELEFEASNVDIENLDEIKDLFESSIDISEFLENYDEIIEAHNNIVTLTKVQLTENRKVINGLKDKLKVTTDVYEKNKLQDQLNESLAKEQELLGDLISQYEELADAQAELDAYGSGGKDEWEKENERQIKALQKQKDELGKENDELERQNDLHEKELELEQLREKLENLKRNRNIQTIKQQEDGTWQWSYESDTKAIKETENEILKLQNEMQEAQDEVAEESQENMIDAEIERLENLAEEKDEYYDEQKEKYLDFYKEQVNNTNRGLDDVDRAMYQGLNEIDSTVEHSMDSINDSMESGMEDLFEKVKNYVEQILAQMARIGVMPPVPDSPAGVLKEATGRETTTPKDIVGTGAQINLNNTKNQAIAGGILGVTGILGAIGMISKFDTGGYTGDWGNNEGKLALLHSKERVLNAEQTKSFDKLVDGITSNKTPKGISNLHTNNTNSTNVTVQNMVLQAEDNLSIDRFMSNVLHQSRAKTSLVGL